MKRIVSALTILCLLISLCSCNTANSQGDYPVKIGSVVINEKPNVTVCMSDSIADIIIACGYSTSITARSEDCDQNEIFPIPTVGTNENPDIDAIVELECDVVLADDNLSDENKDRLTSSGITVISFTPASTRDELSKLYSNISAIFDGNNIGRESGEKKIDNLFSSIDELNRQIPESQIINTACYIYGVEGNTVRLVTGDSFASKLIEYTNTSNIAAGAVGSEMDANQLKMQNPKFVFCAPGVKEKLKGHEILSRLYALSENNVFELDPTAMTRQGNTILTTVEFMVISMYPQLSGNYSDTDKTDTDNTDTESSDTDSSTDTSTDTEQTSDAETESDASDTSGGDVVYIVNSDDGLSLRSSPEKTDNIIGSLLDKQKVTLVEDYGNGWFKVKTEDGTEGYCSSEFLIKEN
ncbi:MAG: ABC transporter substrate-binding protein [Clostridiales bacterium]|nr:ABC transporter substrate-binding protein [Clostridiales bacterium]